MKKENRKRTNVMNVYLNDDEYNRIIESSNRAGLSISTFARNVCLGTEVKSLENHQTRMDLLKVNADLGRLGGLLKLALTETDEQINIRPILRDIDRIKDQLRRKISLL